MKGMQRIKRHKNFINVVKYVLKPGSHHSEAPIVIGGNMTGDCVKELISEFDTVSMLRTDIEKPAWHNSLRLPKNDELTNDQWIKIADDYMTQLGFSDTHLRCYVLHDDPVGQHIHIIANRIDSVSGKINLGRHESLVSGRIIQRLEIKYGLTITKAADPKKPASSVKGKKLSRNETMYEKRTGEVCNKKELQNIIDKSLTGKPELNTFIKRLEDNQVACKANRASSGKMNGFSFEYQSVAFKASQLGKKYSWSNLQKLLNYEPERAEALRTDISPISPAKQQGESLTIAEKIASLTSAIALTPIAKASLALPVAPTPASKTVVKEDKRQQILNAVFDLQNSKKIRQVRPRRFMVWIKSINALKLLGFCLLYAFRKFKRVMNIQALPPFLQTQSQASFNQLK
ncbi:relaxase/mobilization nuclease domain-containing protein [Yersinia sp. 22-579]|uniref:relaxase/mobilization nuclease domain-containing protein n=1 Tax=Yersinia sp. 22-579 TaxID=3057580 RepID=UPI00263B0FB1|nr:relaxase/mobilization nuclease domain-containing protein [Yersinia sp. 22-579]